MSRPWTTRNAWILIGAILVGSVRDCCVKCVSGLDYWLWKKLVGGLVLCLLE